MSDLTITHFEGLMHTPAMLPAAKAWVEMMDLELADPGVLMLNWDDNAILASYEGTARGVLVWQKADWSKAAFTKIAWTAPEYRRQGVYRALWNALVEKCSELKLRRIEGATMLNNTAMRATASALGRREGAIGLLFDLP